MKNAHEEMQLLRLDFLRHRFVPIRRAADAAFFPGPVIWGMEFLRGTLAQPPTTPFPPRLSRSPGQHGGSRRRQLSSGISPHIYEEVNYPLPAVSWRPGRSTPWTATF